MKRNLLLILFAFLCLSFRWPLDNPRITATFGESRGDHFHDGVDIVCADDRVYPAEEGELLFFWDKALFPLDNEPGGGNYAVLSHGNEICSVYMHLEEGSADPGAAASGGQIGVVGNSGHSFAKHLHFSIVNRAERKSVNPLSFLPAGKDSESPKIGAMYLKISGRYMQIRDNASIRLTRHYPILVDIADTATGRERLGVYTLKGSFNGKELPGLKFDAIDFSSEGLTVDGKLFNFAMDEKGYYIFDELTHRQGNNILKVTASDFNGNVSEKTFIYSANLDMEQAFE